MGFNKYPYTDLHEMNLDWIIARTKELIAKWAETSAAWLTQQEAFESLKTYVETWFDNLDIQQEINNKIDALVADGTLSDLIAPYVASGLPDVVADQIAAVVADQIDDVVFNQIDASVARQINGPVALATASWLTDHVDPDTGYVIDETLTISMAAADAKVTGDKITELNSALTDISHDEVSSDNLFDNVFDKTGYYINASTGLDVENANFKCTSKFYPIENYTVVSSTIFQYFAVSSAVASMAVVYYDANKDRVDFAQLNNLTTLDKGFSDTVRFFRVSTYASFDGTVYVSAKQRSNPVDYTYSKRKMINSDALPKTLQDLEEDADDGKVLSSNDFTDAEKEKLSLLNLDLQSFASVTKVYMVGEGMKYATFNAANAAWIADGKPNAVIYLAKGTYIVEDDPNHAGSYPLVFEDGNVIIIGEDKETTIVKTTTGKYIDAPILVRGGNVTLKNLTFIADHSDNPDFDYSQSTTGVSGNAAYAIHIDGGSVGGTVTVENCNAWSWQSCGLGLGTIKNSEIIIKNCDVRSFTDNEIDYPDARVALSRGAIVYHTYATDDTGTEKFTMINNVVYSKNGSVVMKLTKSATAKKDAMFVCNLLQGDEASDVVSGATDFNISDSYGNNASALNN